MFHPSLYILALSYWGSLFVTFISKRVNCSHPAAYFCWFLALPSLQVSAKVINTSNISSSPHAQGIHSICIPYKQTYWSVYLLTSVMTNSPALWLLHIVVRKIPLQYFQLCSIPTFAKWQKVMLRWRLPVRNWDSLPASIFHPRHVKIFPPYLITSLTCFISVGVSRSESPVSFNHTPSL